MPVLIDSSYVPPKHFTNKHIQTVFPTIFRKVPEISYERERVELDDGDFIDLDWARKSGKRLAIILHGMESNSSQNYVKGMAHAFNNRNWDAVILNLRSCSGEINRLYKSYHSGFTEDLESIIRHIVYNNKFLEISVVGFSLGGNIVLKFAGEKGSNTPPIIKKFAAISVPCDLGAVAEKMKTEHRFYMKRFIRSFKKKLRAKRGLFPNALTSSKIRSIKDFKNLDDLYTAPANGYKNAEDYWEQNSSKKYIANIKTPTLLINALDDPFLPKEAFPIVQANNNKFFFFETPEYGGHVGFILRASKMYWHELRVINFIIDGDLEGKNMVDVIKKAES